MDSIAWLFAIAGAAFVLGAIIAFARTRRRKPRPDGTQASDATIDSFYTKPR
ncbi:hypothetical protein [Rhizobium rhizosphaerae]|uniref:hypothetical protein n=1 Tax=Xaviernesmea rhizosphaerae TaxID=1672749 RepID=UPI001594270C|nr:hypothetical protein [Xaviernesmea rhizosphaerae]